MHEFKFAAVRQMDTSLVCCYQVKEFYLATQINKHLIKHMAEHEEEALILLLRNQTFTK